MKPNLLLSAVSTALISCLVTPAFAADASTDDSLTKYGITLYGTLDLGVAYQSHGAPSSGIFPQGIESVISKNSNNALFALTNNGMSQSKLGLKGSEDLTEDLAAIFKLEMNFNPTSGSLANGVGSVAQNNGVALTDQTANSDSSRAGQFFTGAAYGGLNSKTYGALTFGRQNTIMLDNVNQYDPMGSSYFFSVIGYSGLTGGMGNTQDSRLDNSLKYAKDFGPAHIGALYKFGGYGNLRNSAYEAQVGTVYEGLSVDAHFGGVKNAVAASTLPTLNTPNQVAATVSDTTSYALLAKYVVGPVKIYGGWENIKFENPAFAMTPGNTTIGGYILSTVNNTAYNNHRRMNVFWGGVKYSATPTLDLIGAYYHYSQNSYADNGCSDTSSGACSGALNAVSFAADQTINKHFDVYAGAMYSSVSNGLAAGYLYTNTITPAIGGRLNF